MVTAQSAAVLFDLDGCLVDSLPAIARCWAHTLSEFGIAAPTPAEIRPLLGPPSDSVARHFAPGASEDTIAAIVAVYRRRSLTADGTAAFAGVPELLEALAARDVVAAVATSKAIDVSTALLQRLCLDRFVDAVEGTREDELGTDKTTVVARLLERLGPARVLALVGDRAQDVQAARAHRLRSIGALWGYGSERELVRAGADWLASTPSAVLELTGTTGEPADRTRTEADA